MKKQFIFVIMGLCMAFFSNTKADEQLPSQAGNNFGISLYQNLSADAGDENVFISPYSIYTALAITYAGADSTTKAQFEKSLGIKNPATFHAELHKMIESLNERDDKGFRILTANALWIDKQAKLLSSYTNLTKKYYDISENSIDVTEPEKSADKINDWVTEKTEDKIHNLVSPKNITPDTKLIITNAVYFKAEWLHPFEHESTREEDFNPFVGTPIKAQMMHQQAHFKYLTVDGSAFIELPYKGNQLSMIIILPEKKGVAALKEAENKLSANLDKFLSLIIDNSDKVNLTLPKFKIETPLLVLNEPLKKLGITDAFIYPKADFSGINGNHELYIGLVAHKAMINVDEQGTEAAAATAGMMPSGAAYNPNKPKEFRADRPFLYLIRDNETGLILFIGKLLNPPSA